MVKIALPTNKNGQAAPQYAAAHVPTPARPRRRKLQAFLRLLFLLIVVAAGGFLYWRAQAPTAAASPTIPVPVARGNLDVSVESSGKVQAGKSIPVSFETAGQVSEVPVK